MQGGSDEPSRAGQKHRGVLGSGRSPVRGGSRTGGVCARTAFGAALTYLDPYFWQGNREQGKPSSCRSKTRLLL